VAEKIHCRKKNIFLQPGEIYIGLPEFKNMKSISRQFEYLEGFSRLNNLEICS